MTKEDLWQTVLAQIQFHISQANFATWFKNTGIVSQKENLVIVSVPNNFAKEWLENKYNKEILKILRSLNAEIKEIEYKVVKAGFKAKKDAVDIKEEEQLEFQEFKIDKRTNLNPKYVFDNFVVGPYNELAHAAGWAVSKNPGKIYNPLFIYGGVGLGKTHLLQSIGNKINKNSSNKKIKYTPSERFTSGVVTSIRNQVIENFKMEQRKNDVFIIDDVQFLSGKEKTQEELFHIFNALYEKNKQIVFSSDCPPKAIPNIEERLRSRFEGGMIADISAPDFETMVAILKTKCQEKKADIPNEILEYIASRIQKNIRELEGALNRIIIYQKINNQIPDIKQTKIILKNIVSKPVKIISFKKIVRAVIGFYDLKEKDILSSSRKKEIVKPRQVAMYLLREELKSSYPFIGRKFGGKDHTTAIHSCKKISCEIKRSENLDEEITIIKQRIYNESF